MSVPFVDLVAQQRQIDPELQPALARAFQNADFIGGAAVADFERDYARFLGVNHCVGVGNGTDALELALRAVGVGPGSEVVIPVNTFIATAEAILRIGAVPALTDVDPGTLLMDPDCARQSTTDRTSAIIPVHLYGQVASVESLVPIAERVGAVIVEDAAQAQGATRFGHTAGSLGTVAATSFYPGKNLGAAGDAGAVTTDDGAIARHVRMLGAHGSERKYDHEIVGMNSRLDAIQAIVLSAKLARLSEWNSSRRRAAARYAELLSDIDDLTLPRSAVGNEDVWHLYVVRTDHRDRLLDGLRASGIGTGIHYPVPLHQTPALREMLPRGLSFPVAERSSTQIVSLPMFPHITESQQAEVADAVRAALSGRKENRRVLA